MLKAKGLPFNVLNAKQHQREASIVAQAGRKGAITIATNMAGRGTDILLGGNPEAMAKDALAEEKAKLAETVEASQEAEGSAPYRGSSEPEFDEDKRLAELIAEFKKQCEAERAGSARGRRPQDRRHRAPRVAPHRQPAARSRRSPGRSGQRRGSTCRCRTTCSASSASTG